LLLQAHGSRKLQSASRITPGVGVGGNSKEIKTSSYMQTAAYQRHKSSLASFVMQAAYRLFHLALRPSSFAWLAALVAFLLPARLAYICAVSRSSATNQMRVAGGAARVSA